MTASAFTRPAWICGNADTSGSKITWIWPAMRSVMDPALPL